MDLVSSARSFGGIIEIYQHQSVETKTPMRFSIYLPAQAKTKKLPVLYWLSGITCTEENFTVKAGSQQWAAEHGIIVVAPDTSPRGAGIPDEGKDWTVGLGAGFYVNATQTPWSKHYRMYDYVSKELPTLVQEKFPVRADRMGIFGHSMGGHGALVVGLREEDRYQSLSAFAPISAPTLSPWGQNAFTTYLGSDRESWKAYDSHLLIGKAKRKRPILVDQGTGDKFLCDQLLVSKLKDAADAAGFPLQLRLQEGYDHGYYFISTFLREHFAHHAKILTQ